MEQTLGAIILILRGGCPSHSVRGQDVASTEQMHESGPTGALLIGLRFSRMRDNAERRLVRASWKQVAKGVEGFSILTNLVVPRRGIPRIENDALRLATTGTYTRTAGESYTQEQAT